MSDLRYTDFERLLLIATYLETERSGKQIMSAGEILDNYDLKYRDGWVHRAVSDFGSRGLIYGKGTMGGDRDQPLGLKAAGLREAERLLEIYEPPALVSHGGGQDDQSPSATAVLEVPAADRLVTIDHNSPQIKLIEAKSDELVDQLKRGNDLGDLTVEEAGAAVGEVEQIQRAFANDTVRQNTVLSMAKRTLGWIGGKAAEALVGAIAIALLALIFSYFGIVIPL